MAHTNPTLVKWQKMGSSGLGRWLFSRGIGLMAPYSSTIGARVVQLEPGHAVIRMRDRRAVRNHLRSVHAAAMLTLSELTGGLLAMVSIPGNARMIVTHIEIDYVKKARGVLTSTGSCEVPERADHGDLAVSVSVRDEAGDEVCRATVKALIGPDPKRA